MNLIKICLALFLSLTAVSAHASPLSDLAASMKPGTWAELPTNNINPVWGGTNGASGFISGYASEVKWDPVLQKLHYVGMDHSNRPTSKQTVHIAYSALTNTWQFIAQDGTNFHPACSPSCVGSGASHQYDHLAIDPIRRKLYYRYSFTSKQIWQNSLDTGTATSWTPLPINPVVNSTVCCHAIEHVRFLGGLLWVVQNYGSPSGNGRFSFLPDGGTTWQTVGNPTGYSMGLNSGNLECSEVRQLCIFASGAGIPGVNPQGPRLELFKIQKINGVITISQLPNSPFGLGVHYGGVLTVDPVSGDFLFLKDAKTTTEAKQFWKIDGMTGAFTRLPDPPDTVWNRFSGVYDVHGVQAGPNSTHGVVMFVSCQQGANPCRLWIYKHAAAVALPLPPPPPVGVAYHWEITWADNSDNELGFYVYEVRADGSQLRIGNPAVNVKTFQVAGVAAVGTTRCFVVSAYNEAGESAKTVPVCGTVSAVPPAPSGVTVKPL